LILDRERYTIVGVMPAGIRVESVERNRSADVAASGVSDADRAVRGNHNYMVVARLKPGVSISAFPRRIGRDIHAPGKAVSQRRRGMGINRHAPA